MIEPNIWKFTFSSVTGTSHLKLGGNCQDSCVCQIIKTTNSEPIFISVVSDGAGSAKCSETGSKLTCELLLSEIKNFFTDGRAIKDFSRDFVVNLIEFIQKEILLRIENSDLNLRDYACTALAAVIGESSAAFFQIGDGAIVISSFEEPNEYNWVFWPQKGEFENTTYFITDLKAREYVNFDYIEKRVDKIALFSDGIQNLALQNNTQSVHNPFFNRLFNYLDSCKEFDPNKLALPLNNFFNSELVNERTDDDKTLVLALRKLNNDETL